MDSGVILEQTKGDELDEALVRELCRKWPVGKAIVATTRCDADREVALLRGIVPHVLEFTPDTPVPLKNGYLTPRTLGRDRMAAAVGAWGLYPGRNIVVVDCGTAITIDLVSKEGVFLGGVISPGVNMRFRALKEYTAKLPLCAPTDEQLLVGRSTVEAIEAGVMNSVSFEIEGYISRISEKFEDLCIIFTGGDAKYFAKRIKNTIFANYNLILYGLERILEFDASEENLI